MTGYTRQETLGRNCNFIQGASTLTDTIQQFSFLLASAQCGLFEILNYRKDGTPFWNLVYVEPICDQYGLVDKFFGVQVDISDVLDRHHDRTNTKFYDETGRQIGPMRQANMKAMADVALLEDGSVQASQSFAVFFVTLSFLTRALQANSRTIRPFLGDRQVIDLVQQAVHSGTPSMIETRFPNRSGPSMLFVRSSPTVKNFVDALQVVLRRTLSLTFCSPTIATMFSPFCLMLSCSQCNALTSVESGAPLPKEQRDIKVVQVLATAFFCAVSELSIIDLQTLVTLVTFTLSSVSLPALVSAVQKTRSLRQPAAGGIIPIAHQRKVCSSQRDGYV